MSVQYKDLKKGDKLKTVQLGDPVTSYLMESPRQGKGLKTTILVDTKGSEIGFCDEMGSVYATDIWFVNVEGEWREVTDQPS